MPEEIKKEGSAEAGSPGNQADPVKAGQSAQETVAKTAYEELEKKLGTQGQELGEYRTFFQNISPLLDKLDASPELVESILNDKVNPDLVKAVAEGRVEIKDAADISKAHEEVKKELGKEEYAKATPEEIEKKISEKLEGVTKEFDKKLSEADELRRFEDQVATFISSTPDFSEYAERVEKWLDEHPEQDDIEVAYHAVKGEAAVEEAKKKEEEAAGEAAKEVAANAGGGGSQASGSVKDKKLVDELISGRVDPNTL